jgi:hypothetical protein
MVNVTLSLIARFHEINLRWMSARAALGVNTSITAAAINE